MTTFTRAEPLASTLTASHVEYADVLRGYNAGRAFDMVVADLAALGSGMRRLALRVRDGVLAWDAARRQQQQARRVRNLTLSDAQTLAQLNRAMNRQAGL